MVSGVYDVTTFVVNNDTIAPLQTDTLRWLDLIIDKGGVGSIRTSDTAFRRRYGRAYFNFTVDPAKQMLYLKKNAQISTSIATFHFQKPDSSTIILRGKKGMDSLYVTIKKSNRHFQLAERQFHWLSEANR
jgi:hypothetical protein